MFSKQLFLALAMTVAAVAADAAPRSEAQMKAAAQRAINEQRAARRLAPRTDALKVLQQTGRCQVMGYDQGGFAVVAADDLAPEVLGVSVAAFSNGRNKNFAGWLKTVDEVVDYAVRHHVPLKVTTPDPDKYPVEVLPLVTTKWDQEAPYDGMCPTYSGSTHCLTGCVATAMAQILNYHQTPEHGYGQRTIRYGSQNVTAHFDEDYYDWDNMLDFYLPGNYNQQQADAVALLMRDCGVAANMGYGGPDEGSGAYSTDAASGLRTYFGFEDAECLERNYYSEENWMNIIYRELSENGPLYYGGADYSYGGHAFVFDGYRADGMVSVNWGWSGDEDGYYQVSILDPAYYSWSYGQDMIIGVKSDKHSLLRSVDVTVTEAGNLQQTTEALEVDGQIGVITVSGPLDASDLVYLRALAGRDADDGETDGQLRTLDLTHAVLPANTLPERAFQGCSRLQRVRLPETLAAVGREAFSGCVSLVELRVPTRQVPTIKGSGVFEGVPFEMARLYVRSGLKTKYGQTAQWKNFTSVVEFGTSVKVRNTIRYYGAENPDFTYTVTGDAIDGEPLLTCDATPSSPAGRYPIYITRGTVTTGDVDFIDGYLVVQRVDAAATVQDAERMTGQPNPTFALTYEGLINGDLTPVWTAEPVFDCPADETSPVGTYPITVKSATAESYNLTFTAGTLTVVEATQDIREIGTKENAAPVYNLRGQRVAQPAKGLYIRSGQKFLNR